MDDFPISLNKDENLSMIILSMLQIPSMKNEQQFENINHFKKILPSFIQFTQYDYD